MQIVTSSLCIVPTTTGTIFGTQWHPADPSYHGTATGTLGRHTDYLPATKTNSFHARVSSSTIANWTASGTNLKT